MRIIILTAVLPLFLISFADAQPKALAELANYRGADREELLKTGAKKEAN